MYDLTLHKVKINPMQDITLFVNFPNDEFILLCTKFNSLNISMYKYNKSFKIVSTLVIYDDLIKQFFNIYFKPI